MEGVKELGHHPDTGEAITLRRGPYGPYVQQGEADPQAKIKPRRASLTKGMQADTLTLEQALGLLSLPRVVGIHPELHEEVRANVGRFGPYVQVGNVYASLDRDDDVLVIGLNRAMDLLAKKLAGIRQLGPHPKDAEPVAIKRGKFGPYAQHGKTVANLPKAAVFDAITLDEAVTLLAEKGKVLAGRGGAKKKAAPKKPARAKETVAAEAAPAAKAIKKPKPRRKSG